MEDARATAVVCRRKERRLLTLSDDARRADELESDRADVAGLLAKGGGIDTRDTGSRRVAALNEQQSSQCVSSGNN